jgi:hypothetical protein
VFFDRAFRDSPLHIRIRIIGCNLDNIPAQIISSTLENKRLFAMKLPRDGLRRLLFTSRATGRLTPESCDIGSCTLPDFDYFTHALPFLPVIFLA